MKKFLLLSLIALLPSSALAASHNYICDNFHQFAQVSCTDDVYTFSNTPFANNSSLYANGGDSFMSGSTLYYVSFDYSGTGDLNVSSTGNVNDGTVEVVSDSGSACDIEITTPSGNSWNSLFFNTYSGTAFVGDISNVVASDEPLCGGEDEETPPPPDWTLSTSTVSIDSVNVDIFMGFVIFLGTMTMTMWMFRRP